MAEFAGFPEIGALSLLYYRSGGSLDCSVPPRLALKALGGNAAELDSTRILSQELTTSSGCGCGQELCGSILCHFPIDLNNATLKGVVSAMDAVEGHFDSTSGRMRSSDIPTAASILELLSKQAKLTGRKKSADRPDSCPPSQHNIPNLLPGDVFAKLRFWEGSAGAQCPSGRFSTHGDEARCRTRPLSPLLQILLLKHLYVAPIGGAFLHLSCEAVAHISAAMPLSSKLGRSMAKDFKSHWAYFVLIRAVVLGERVKVHRRGAVPYHVPVWDIVHGLDNRKFAHGKSPCHISGVPSVNDVNFLTDSFVDQLCIVVKACSSYGLADASNQFECSQLPVVIPSLPKKLSILEPAPLFVLGDSHVLSIAWQTIRIRQVDSALEKISYRLAVPFPSTGIKAWHTRRCTRFFTYYNLRSCLGRLPVKSKTVVLSAGEIDVREGIGGKLLEGYYGNCDDAVRNTVRMYVKAVAFLAEEFDKQILLLPVAPHAYRSEKNGKSTGRALRRVRTELWNDVLREVCRVPMCDEEKKSGNLQRVFLLDYEKELRAKDDSSPVGYVLNKFYNADFTHTNSAMLSRLEDSVHRSGCDFRLL
mmetsp:Transcript_48078/g.145195  ORF Transcript_48078/g.145195 Transcript_48078/m.145195 type:complete len:589 (-) Transcript_48078:23-1789(-)